MEKSVFRWSEIANYVNEHRENKNVKRKTEKDVLIQVFYIDCSLTAPSENYLYNLGCSLVLHTISAEIRPKKLFIFIRGHKSYFIPRNRNE